MDGSDQSLTAVEHATRIAVARNRPLRIVHGFVSPVYTPVPPTLGTAALPADAYGELDAYRDADASLRAHAEQVVEHAQTHARHCAPGVRVSAEVIDGGAAAVLTSESDKAALLVVGQRGHGGFGGLLLGSVAVQVAAHAACPFLVTRGEHRRSGPVAVGVDGAPTSAAAIAFAADEAEWRRASLLAVHAWTAPVSTGPGDMLPLVYDVDRVEAEERRVLAESVAGLAETHPDLPVEQRLVSGRAAEAFKDLSRHAQLVVVGSRGHGGFVGLLLGSVSRALIHHADCPVAVVRPVPPPKQS
ncbi:universal stress protein [Micromonospora sp. CPCC 205371]|nr:universal stress protein [Micromonospora sp. CPCC 205371]